MKTEDKCMIFKNEKFFVFLNHFFENLNCFEKNNKISKYKISDNVTTLGCLWQNLPANQNPNQHDHHYLFDCCKRIRRRRCVCTVEEVKDWKETWVI